MMKTSTGLRLFRILAIALLVSGIMPGVYANTFNVTQTSDGNAASQLRGAILAADALGGGPHTINVPAGTYNLTLGPIKLGTKAQNISIVGAGAASTIVNMTATMQNRILLINEFADVSGVTTSISGIKFTGGKSPGNYGGGAILCGGPNNVVSITNCAFEGNVSTGRGGGALSIGGGGVVTVDNCIFTNNQANVTDSDNASGGAILISYISSTITVTGSVSITNSTFTGNFVSSTRFTYGGAIHVLAEQSPQSPSFYTKIEKNKFINNNTSLTTDSEGGAISILSDFTVDVNYNVFAGNTLGGSVKQALSAHKSGDGAVNAANNWWSCNTDPQAAGTCSESARVIGEIGIGTLTTVPFLVLKPTVTQASLCIASSSQTAVTASFLNNSAGTAISLSNLSTVIGLPVSFSAVNGNISNAQSAIQADGKAMATYNASSAGNGSVNVLAGHLTSSDLSARAVVAVGAAPTVSAEPADKTVCSGVSVATFSANANSATTVSYQWYKGNSVLSNDDKYGGVNTATLMVNNIVAGDHNSQYKVKISNDCGDTFSEWAELNVLTNRLYVAEGESGEGSGWDDAIGDLSNALGIAASCNGISEIWVKAGTYKPSGQPYDSNPGDLRHNAFYLLNNVAIYGGFAGNETLLSERNAGANQTILSGDIGLAGNADNSYHTVVTVNNDISALLDGFIIRDGNADGTDISTDILGANVLANSGGGIAIYTSSPVIRNCVFTANTAALGGGIYVVGEGAIPFIGNSVISDNVASNAWGGGIFNGLNSAATIQNCTITRNTASGEGAGVFNFLASHPFFANTIIAGNSGPLPVNMQDALAEPVLFYSLVAGGHSGTGMLDDDPLFADFSDPDGADDQWMTADDGLRLLACSPAINTGLFTGVNPSKDILGQARVFDVNGDMGAYELQSYRDGSSLSLDGDIVSQTIIDGTTNGFLVSGCRVITQVTPSGASAVSGSVQAKTFIAGSVISSGAVSFVQRHYEILPASNAEGATATIKLFFTQTEFDAFNTSVGGAKLPASPSDGTGKANLLVVQYHGVSTTGLPGSYDGDITTINPDNDKIVWNSDLNRWEITFDVTGFSGFFISNADPLPLKLVSFTAQTVEDNTLLEWLTAEEFNTSHFEIHRSADARNWQLLPEQPAAVGSGGHRYKATDREPSDGMNYYRLKMIDRDGSFAFSQIAVAEHRNAFNIRVFPNPATTWLQLELTGNGVGTGNVELLNVTGKIVSKGTIINGKASLPVENIPKGIYLIRVQSSTGLKTRKVSIE